VIELFWVVKQLKHRKQQLCFEERGKDLLQMKKIEEIG
jgi:hypothetical protein